MAFYNDISNMQQMSSLRVRSYFPKDYLYLQ